MVAKLDLIFGLVIFLTIGAVILVVVVVYVLLYARKLRKKVDAEFFGDSKLVQKVTVRKKKRNKYTPSEHRKNEHELSYYESPPLTDAQRERLKENQAANRAGNGLEVDLSSNVKKNKLSATDSYIEVLKSEGTSDSVSPIEEPEYDIAEDLYIENFDELAPDYVSGRMASHQDKLYTEPNERQPGVTLHARQVNQNKFTGGKTKASKINPPQSHVTQLRNPVTQHGSRMNPSKSSRPKTGGASSKAKDDRKPRPSQKPKNVLAPHVTQQETLRNASHSLPRLGKANQGFNKSEELYGNQEIIDQVSKSRSLDYRRILNETENSNDEIYGNQVIIDDQKNNNQVTGDTGYPMSHYANDERFYGNQEIIEDNLQQEIYENCIEQESLYENYNTTKQNNSVC